MKIPKFFWTSDEGKWIAFDKICHVILHFIIVKGLRLIGVHPTLAFFISQDFGWRYEWLWDCWLVETGIVKKIASWLPIIKNIDIKITGASKKDVIANNLGAIIGMVI